MSVAKLMTALMNEHNGPQETNRVQYNKEDVTWVIRPPRNYKLDSSLPPNMAIIDRREKARLEEQARVLSQIIQNARGNKIAEQLIEKSLNEVKFLALGGTGAVGSEDTPIDTYMRVEEADCVNSTFEEAITPPNPKLIVNSKISKPTIARVMIANSAAENTGMCATQYPRTFMRAAIAKKARGLKATANNKAITSSTLIEGGKGVVPQMAREMAQHGNQRTIDLSKKQKKNNLIAELKARGKDNYKKIRRGSSAGEPTTDVNELVLRNMLRDANDGNDIVVLKSTSAGSSWKARGAGPNST